MRGPAGFACLGTACRQSVWHRPRMTMRSPPLGASRVLFPPVRCLTRKRRVWPSVRTGTVQMSLANLAARLLRTGRDDLLAERLAELHNGDVPALLSAGRDLKFTGSLAGERDKALHYFETNAHRMHYA